MKIDKSTKSLNSQWKSKRKLNHNSTELNLGPREERHICLLGDPSDSFSPVLPNGPIFSDFGPESDFFEQNGPELVRINTQKSGLGGNKQRQINNVLYLRDIDRS